MKRGHKKAQVWYFTSVMLILIGFAFFGAIILISPSMNGDVISSVNLPTTCSDANIQSVWDSVFWESSGGISIIKNNTVYDGKCVKYFATKHNANEFNDTYVLYGYTNVGNNITYVFAEHINMTSLYWDGFLLNITNIENVSLLMPTRDNSFSDSYVQARTEVIDNSNAATVFNRTFRMNQTEIWVSESDFGDSAYGFSNNSFGVDIEGKILVNHGYSLFYLISNPVDCSVDVDCSSWSTCIGGVQNMTCINSSLCYEDISYNVTRNCSDCVANWSIGSWSPCINGTQTRYVLDLYNCGLTTGMPATNKPCNLTCTSDWVCSDWMPEACPSNGIQTRNCTDKNSCEEPFKIETQSCGVVSKFSPASASGTKSNVSFGTIFFIIIVIVFLAIIGLIIWFIFLVKGKDENGSKGTSGVSPPFAPRPSGYNSMAKKILFPAKRVIPMFKPRPKPNLNFSKYSKPSQNKIPFQNSSEKKRVAPPKRSSVWGDLRKISEK